MKTSISIVIAVILLSLFSVGEITAQEKVYTLEQVTVTATRLDEKFAETRSIAVIESGAIAELPVRSVAELMNHALGVTMNSRGNPGVISDPSLRGAGFEQVLILVDGVRMNNPQTGHHNTNLPVALQDIERIEVLRGQSSALYGPDAFGGVINIITKSAAKRKTEFSLTGGSFGSVDLSGTLPLPGSDDFASSVSFNRSSSDGYRDDTDFENNSVNLKSELVKENVKFTATAGYSGKDFGANDFYVKGFDHYEEISALTAGLNTSIRARENLTFKAYIHHKHNEDYFELSRSNPSMYIAEHTTTRTIVEATGNYDAGSAGEFIFGFETAFEDIESTTLGTHDNDRNSLFGEYGITVKNTLILNAGMRFDRHSLWGNQFNPSVSAGYVINSSLMLKASAGRSFRAPTFTELYSPAASQNIGDTSLKPEKALSFDIGAEYSFSGSDYRDLTVSGSTTIFRRDQSETIDWIRDSVDDPWQVVNIFDVTASGIEQALNVSLSGVFSLRMNYTFLEQSKEQEGFISKYLFIHPKHQFSLTPTWNASSRFSVTPSLSYRYRKGMSEDVVLDTRLRYSFNRFDILVEGLNLTNVSYEEIRDVPMPGRAVYAGFAVRY